MKRTALSKKLLGVGLVVTLLGAVAYMLFATHAALYVPICQTSSTWSMEGRCRWLAMEVWATAGVFILGVLFMVSAGVVRVVNGSASKPRHRM